MSYSIYTLWGELDNGDRAQVEVKVPVDFFQEKSWKLVVERKTESGFSIQKDTTIGLTLFEALDTKQGIVEVYVKDGYISNDGLTYIKPGQQGSVLFYIDTMAHVLREENNLIPA